MGSSYDKGRNAVYLAVSLSAFAVVTLAIFVPAMLSEMDETYRIITRETTLLKVGHDHITGFVSSVKISENYEFSGLDALDRFRICSETCPLELSGWINFCF